MSDERTNEELAAIIYQSMNDPCCQACLAQHECDREHPLCEQALDELVRRADESQREVAVMRKALEMGGRIALGCDKYTCDDEVTDCPWCHPDYPCRAKLWADGRYADARNERWGV